MISSTDLKFFKLCVGHDLKGTDIDYSIKCPICGDSNKKQNSRRLHIYNKNSITGINCFNGDCPVHNKNLYSFLRDFYPEHLQQYKKETFKSTIESIKESKTLGSMINASEPESPPDDGLGFLFDDEDSDYRIQPEVVPEAVQTLDLISVLSEMNSLTSNYVKSRGFLYSEIEKDFGKFYYAHQDLEIDGTLYRVTGSLIIPLYYNHKIYGFYSRSCTEKTFITFMIDSNIGYKIWNWFNIDKSEPVYIFEGVFDAISSGKKNCIALLGAKLPQERLNELKDPVLVLDNDRTGLLNSLQYVKSNQKIKVFVQPKNIIEKDMNELLLNKPDLNISDLIDQNLFSSVKANIMIQSKL